jgi:predicted dehydrogenase
MHDGKELRIGMVGYAFMGAAHSQAWRTVNRVYDLPVRARMVAVCGRDPDGVAAAAARLGWEEAVGDWRALVDRDDIDVIDICTPGDSHAEIAIAALAAGKHVLCEKPLANSVDEAAAMVAAAGAARAQGVRAMCGFTYRRVPAVALMRQLVADGRLGAIRHVRAAYLQDWLVDPEFPLAWRLQRERAGSGALGDIGAHIIDLTQYVTGQLVTGVSGITETFVRERPLPASSSGLSAAAVPDGNGAAGADVPRGDARPAMRRCSSPGSPAGRSPPMRRAASPPGARTRCAWSSTASAARWRSTSSASTNSSSTTPPGPAPSRGSPGSW